MPNTQYQESTKKAYREKNKRIEFSLSAEDYLQLKKITSDLGYGDKVGRLAKQFTLAYLTNHYKNNSLIDDTLKQLILLLRTVANNIKQIAIHSKELNDIMIKYDLLGTIAKSEKNLKDYSKHPKQTGESNTLIKSLEQLYTSLKIQTDGINHIAHDTNTFARLDDINQLFDYIKAINDLIENTVKD